AGLGGIPERRRLSERSRTWLIRPLLNVPRTDLVAYLARRGGAYMHDATNDDIHAATRNRIRHVLMPAIERDINPQAATALARLAQQAAAANRLLSTLAAELLDGCIVEHRDGEIVLDAERFASSDECLR